MNQIERIVCMEQILDEATNAVSSLSGALEKYAAVGEKLRELIAYYEGGQWRADFEDDCAGKLPHDLKRGVLSEDAVYNLLTDIAGVNETMKSLCGL